MATNNDEKFDLPAQEIDKLVDIYTKSPRRMNNLGSDIIKQIKTRTRLGYGVQIGGRKIRLKKLSDNYKAARRGMKRFFRNKKTGGTFVVEALSAKELKAYRASKEARKENKALKKSLTPTRLSLSTRPAKSNLTATGLMLESLTKRVVGTRIFISLRNRRDVDMYGNNAKATSNQKASWQAKAGRRFLDLANFEQKIFKERVTKEILAISKNIIRKFI